MSRFAVLISSLLFTTALLAAEAQDAVYDLHEWGVFPIARNSAWAMSDMRAEWATFPDFFYRVWPKKRLPYFGPVTKPVVYFHAERLGPVQLTIKFAEGRPLVWWPATSQPADGIGEATALDKVWEQGLFKRDGLSVFYRVPQTTYDTWLPLAAVPVPRKIVRVGIVFHAHLEPDLDARVEALVTKLASENFEERQAAEHQIARIGGAAFPVLEKHFNDPDAEVARACHQIIAALDVVPALEPKEK